MSAGKFGRFEHTFQKPEAADTSPDYTTLRSTKNVHFLPSALLCKNNYLALSQNRCGCHCEERSSQRSNPLAVNLA